MKRLCFGVCAVMLFSSFAPSQANQSESKQGDAAAPYDSATLLHLTARTHTQTQELQHTSVLSSPIITETIVTYEFAIRSGALRYISRYTPEKQPGNLPDAWWKGNAPIQMRVRKRALFIKLANGGEISSNIVSQKTDGQVIRR